MYANRSLRHATHAELIKEARSAALNTQDQSGSTPADNPDDLAPTKVHIRGLDNLTTDNIRQFAGEYYSLDNFQRVEWIDDTSANLIYESAEAASEALNALSDLPDGAAQHVAPLQMRKARALPSNSEAELYIRQATLADKKAPRAHERSRFYLMNPDHDPRERKADYDNRRRGPRRDNRSEERRVGICSPERTQVDGAIVALLLSGMEMEDMALTKSSPNAGRLVAEPSHPHHVRRISWLPLVPVKVR